jgi:sulfite exporter TauE/SafE
MDPLILAAAFLGLAGAPHCAAMCGAPCAAMGQRFGRGRRVELMAVFGSARLLTYAAGGAAVAAGIGGLEALGRSAPLLRPMWTLIHVAVLGLGLWMLLTGRQPAAWVRLGQGRADARPQPAGGWQRVMPPVAAGMAGSACLLLPCGLLQSALLVAALASTPLQGAAAMASFAAASSLGLLLPARLGLGVPGRPAATRWALRAAGALLAAGSAWALGHGLWERVVNACQAS